MTNAYPTQDYLERQREEAADRLDDAADRARDDAEMLEYFLSDEAHIKIAARYFAAIGINDRNTAWGEIWNAFRVWLNSRSEYSDQTRLERYAEGKYGTD